LIVRILLICVLLLHAYPAAAVPGADVFSRFCERCHGPDGKGGDIGPSLAAATDRQLIVETVQKGRGKMPPFQGLLTQDEIAAVADYVWETVAGFSVEGADLSRGGVVYRINCSPCHRTAVRGGALVYSEAVVAPPLVGLNTAAIARAIRTGPGPMPAFPASVFDDSDLRSIVRYVRFMQDPPHPGGLPLGFYGPVAEGLVAFAAVGILVVICGWIEFRGRG
jgi:ubiquinol-cytochrome c reductase cytochrome c subunit